MELYTLVYWIYFDTTRNFMGILKCFNGIYINYLLYIQNFKETLREYFMTFGSWNYTGDIYLWRF